MLFQELLGQNDGLYSQGPPSVASGQRSYSHSGYDGLPIESMQGLDISSHPGSTYGAVDGGDHPTVEMGGSEVNFDQEVPPPPQDNHQVAAWYDTDL